MGRPGGHTNCSAEIMVDKKHIEKQNKFSFQKHLLWAARINWKFLCHEGMRFNMCFFSSSLYWVSPCVVPIMTLTTNKCIIRPSQREASTWGLAKKKNSVGYNRRILDGYNRRILVGYNRRKLVGYDRRIPWSKFEISDGTYNIALPDQTVDSRQ